MWQRTGLSKRGGSQNASTSKDSRPHTDSTVKGRESRGATLIRRTFAGCGLSGSENPTLHGNGVTPAAPTPQDAGSNRRSGALWNGSPYRFAPTTGSLKCTGPFILLQSVSLRLIFSYFNTRLHGVSTGKINSGFTNDKTGKFVFYR